MRRQSGMTLLEVLIALAILALAGTGLLRAAMDTSVNVMYFHKQQYAQWAAVEFIVQQRLKKHLLTNHEQGKIIKMGRYKFKAIWKILETSTKGVYRVNLKMIDENYGDAENPSYEISYLIRR
jgi:general secretion pathway protein I